MHTHNRIRLSRVRFAESSGRAQPAKTTKAIPLWYDYFYALDLNETLEDENLKTRSSRDGHTSLWMMFDWLFDISTLE